MIKDFFKVNTLEQVFDYIPEFSVNEPETVPLEETLGRALAENIVSDIDLPDFPRATMDGYAVAASSTFGASDSNPAMLVIKGVVAMGESPDFSIGPGEAARISTGGMLPAGTDAVVMIEHTDMLDDTTIEVYKSVAPGIHMIQVGEDASKGEILVHRGRRIRPQETGLMAAFGQIRAAVHKRPKVGIISTGDEVVPVDRTPGPGQIRDINTYTLSGMVADAGGLPKLYGIIPDDYDTLFETCARAIAESDMVLISGGSSVGMRDLTIEALSALPDSHLLVHGISISPGKPTILANVVGKPFWGLPGHVVSAMVVFYIVVRPFLDHISGLAKEHYFKPNILAAKLTRNLPSAQGRTDFVRVRLTSSDGQIQAEPVLGKSGLIRTMVKADGLVKIDINSEGVYEGEDVEVIVL